MKRYEMMDLKQKIMNLSTELYLSLNEENKEYMEILVDVVERECLIDNEYLFSIYEIIQLWKEKQDKPVEIFIEELYEYLNGFT